MAVERKTMNIAAVSPTSTMLEIRTLIEALIERQKQNKLTRSTLFQPALSSCD